MLLAGLSLLLLADVAVPKVGPVLHGEMTLDKVAGTLALGAKLYRLEDLLLVEKNDGHMVWAASFRARLLGYQRLFETKRLSRVVRMLKDAVKSRHAKLCREIYDAAVRGGWSGSDVEKYRKRVERLERKPPTRVKAQVATEIRKRFRATTEEHADLLLERAEFEPTEVRLKLLGEALRIDPTHARATNRIQEWVPENNPFATPRDYLTWYTELEPLGFRLVHDDVELKRQRHAWRPDLYGIGSDDLLVLTPIKSLDVLRGALKHAHIVLSVLKEMFHTDKPVARNPAPMLVFFYANKQNFLEQRRYKSTATVPPYYRFDQGHFDRRDNVTRLLGDVSGRTQRLLYWILKHEMVRHWLWTKNPRYSSKQVLGSFTNPGYWIVPGMAHCVAESASDLAAMKLHVERKIDPMALLARTAPLPWREFLIMDREDASRLEGKRAKILTSWYYAKQAATACHYLWNKAPGRKQLADYVSNYYAGRTAELNPKTAFGLAAKDFGAAVLAHAKK